MARVSPIFSALRTRYYTWCIGSYFFEKLVVQKIWLWGVFLFPQHRASLLGIRDDGKGTNKLSTALNKLSTCYKRQLGPRKCIGWIKPTANRIFLLYSLKKVSPPSAGCFWTMRCGEVENRKAKCEFEEMVVVVVPGLWKRASACYMWPQREQICSARVLKI